jgi:hypothetical protein
VTAFSTSQIVAALLGQDGLPAHSARVAIRNALSQFRIGCMTAALLCFLPRLPLLLELGLMWLHQPCKEELATICCSVTHNSLLHDCYSAVDCCCCCSEQGLMWLRQLCKEMSSYNLILDRV